MILNFLPVLPSGLLDQWKNWIVGDLPQYLRFTLALSRKGPFVPEDEAALVFLICPHERDKSLRPLFKNVLPRKKPQQRKLRQETTTKNDKPTSRHYHAGSVLSFLQSKTPPKMTICVALVLDFHCFCHHTLYFLVWIVRFPIYSTHDMFHVRFCVDLCKHSAVCMIVRQHLKGWWGRSIRGWRCVRRYGCNLVLLLRVTD